MSSHPPPARSSTPTSSATPVLHSKRIFPVDLSGIWAAHGPVAQMISRNGRAGRRHGPLRWPAHMARRCGGRLGGQPPVDVWRVSCHDLAGNHLGCILLKMAAVSLRTGRRTRTASCGAARRSRKCGRSTYRALSVGQPSGDSSLCGLYSYRERRYQPVELWRLALLTATSLKGAGDPF